MQSPSLSRRVQTLRMNMDFNIVVPSIAKTLGMPAETSEDLALLSQELMNVLAKNKPRVEALAGAEETIKELMAENETIKSHLNTAEKTLAALMVGPELSNIVKDKNIKIVNNNGIKIDYINQRMDYKKATD